jgi:hypothetical protein
LNIKPENNGGGSHSKDIFDLEELHDHELLPLIRQLCDKAQTAGVPIFIVTCYKSDGKGAWLASSGRARGICSPGVLHHARSRGGARWK